jgi:hypothetical protein
VTHHRFLHEAITEVFADLVADEQAHVYATPPEKTLTEFGDRLLRCDTAGAEDRTGVVIYHTQIACLGGAHKCLDCGARTDEELSS